METEFDKEMDALLRQATRSGEITSNTDFTSHLDADEISIFAENALPEKAQARVTKHLADCDRCRIILTNTITLNSEAAGETVSAGVSGTEKEVVSVAGVPWYKRFFATQNLAYGLGGLALVFAGMLGFLVVQNSFNPQNGELAQDTASKESSSNSARDFGGELPQATPDLTNSNIAPASADTNSTTPLEEAKSQVDPNSPVPNGPRPTDADGDTLDRDQGYKDRERNESDLNDNVSTDDKGDFRKKRSDKPIQEESREISSERKNKQDKAGNRFGKLEKEQSPPAPPAPRKSTAARTSARKPTPRRTPRKTPRPAQDGIIVSGASKVEEKSKVRRQKKAPPGVVSPESVADEDSSASKNINGKTFRRRSGIWYDSQYRGQTTKTVKRSSGEYKKLDSGLRTIVSKLGGTVVIVWKSKAYRIR